MDPIVGDFVVDIDCLRRVNDEGSVRSPLSSVKNHAKSLLAKVSGVFVDGGSTKGGLKENLLSSPAVASTENGKPVTASTENGKPVTAKGEDSVNNGDDEKVGKEKRKKTTNKNASKPPRPPKGPLLDAADEKLIREIKEIAMLKRARIDRMKALKRMKATKQSSPSSSSSYSSSSNNSIIVTVLTAIFFLVILFQGMPCRSTKHASFQGHPVSAQVEAGFISVQFSGNPSASYPNGLSSASPKLVEEVAGSVPHERSSSSSG
ncbi:hypothetical protein ACFE04_013128 [Oxalis oulophora]